MEKYLITGAAGFVGLALVNALLKNNQNKLVLVDDFARGRADAEWEKVLSHPSVTFLKGDMTDATFVATLPLDCDYVFHLAAVIGVRNVRENPDRVLYVNTISTLFLLDHLKHADKKPKRVVFSSTSEIVAGTQKYFDIPIPTPEDVPITLGDLKEPRSTYLLSKAAGESACFTYSKIHNLPCTIVRFYNVYGPRMGYQHVIPELFIKLSQNNKVDIASPDHTRAFCYIDDAIEAIMACVKLPGDVSHVINVGNSSQEITMRDLAKIIVETIGANTELVDAPETPGSPPRRCPDTSRLFDLTGFKAKVSLEEGVKKTYEWYKTRLEDRYE
ncbi:MAG: NAD-dependent epimerase/dehydratase family protein [Alphaproteobacteria bacterium]|nr:NAD-dependent epimerase/dehydratase family protein [Alphaproteobacteria bacterium]NCQ89124.1 NAD-dependent epimerase/dehydratase family protein [Alphaproteobacteria bacterium]NCT08228.1 NAD-dependent epimerase/dehydratase family protein [Alphaproteobacteria bacterium]